MNKKIYTFSVFFLATLIASLFVCRIMVWEELNKIIKTEPLGEVQGVFCNPEMLIKVVHNDKHLLTEITKQLNKIEDFHSNQLLKTIAKEENSISAISIFFNYVFNHADEELNILKIKNNEGETIKIFLYPKGISKHSIKEDTLKSLKINLNSFEEDSMPIIQSVNGIKIFIKALKYQ